MAQTDAHTSHVAIDIDHAAASCCPVCMEPPEWVAAGPCGHGEVCVGCAVRLRFFEGDRRCCMCRQLCPAVFITRADDHHGRGDQQQQPTTSELPPPPPAASSGGAGRRYDWYHAGMGAYFDDQEQYERVSKACLMKPSSPAAAVAGGEETRATLQVSCSDLLFFVLDLVSAGLWGAAAGIPLAIYLKHLYQRVILMLGLGVFWAAVAFWYRTRPDDNPE